MQSVLFDKSPLQKNATFYNISHTFLLCSYAVLSKFHIILQNYATFCKVLVNPWLIAAFSPLKKSSLSKNLLLSNGIVILTPNFGHSVLG